MAVGMIIAYYTYTDADGKPLFRKLRHEPKSFSWERYADGVWVSGRDSGECPLYNLPAVVKAIESGQNIWIVEGEKDADKLTSIGEKATTNPDGAGDGKWRGRDTLALIGAQKVRIIADRDEQGHDFAQDIYGMLYGSVSHIEIFETAVDIKGADVSDHLDAGFTLAELVPVEADFVPGLARRPEYPVESLCGPQRDFVDWAVDNGLHAEAAGPAAMPFSSAWSASARR